MLRYNNIQNYIFLQIGQKQALYSKHAKETRSRLFSQVTQEIYGLILSQITIHLEEDFKSLF